MGAVGAMCKLISVLLLLLCYQIFRRPSHANYTAQASGSPPSHSPPTPSNLHICTSVKCNVTADGMPLTALCFAFYCFTACNH